MVKNIVILFLVLCLTGFAFLGTKKNEKTQHSFETMKANFSMTENDLSSMILIHSRYANPFHLPEKLSLTDETNKTVTLGDISGNSEILVCKVSRYNCSSCIENGLNLLDTLTSDKSLKSRVVIISDNFSIRELKIIKSNFKIDFPVFQINDAGAFGSLMVEQLNSPYFFVLDSAYQADMVFVPKREYPGVTEKYIKGVSKYLVRE